MAGLTPGLTKSFKAGAQVPARRIIKFGANDTQALVASASTDALIGVSTEIQAEIGENVDVVMSDIGNVTYGGPVTRGDMVTADAVGRAVLAAPAAGANCRIVGIAMVSAVIGDIGPVLISPSSVQG